MTTRKQTAALALVFTVGFVLATINGYQLGWKRAQESGIQRELADLKEIQDAVDRRLRAQAYRLAEPCLPGGAICAITKDIIKNQIVLDLGTETPADFPASKVP